MASKKRKPKKKPRVVRAWALFSSDGNLLWHGDAPMIRERAAAVRYWKQPEGSVRRVRIEVEP